MDSTPRLQSGLGREKDVYKEGADLTTLFLARVTSINYKYNTVDVVTVGGYSADTFASAQGTDGKYSAKLPLEFGGVNYKDKTYGTVTPVEVGNLVLIGFINGKKKTPVVIGIYADDTVANKIAQTDVASTDENNSDFKADTNSKYTLYPSLTYSSIDGRGNRTLSLTGKTFFVATDSDARVANLYDSMTGSMYESQKASYYNDGELIEPISEKAPIILFKHQGITTDDGDPDTHVFMAFLDRDGTMRLTETDSEDAWRSFLQLSPDKSIGLYQDWNTNVIGEADEKEQSHIAILPDGTVSLKSGAQEWTLRDSTILVGGQDAVEASLSKQMEDVNDLLNLYQTINTYTSNITTLSTMIRNFVKANGKDSLKFSQRLDIQVFYMDLQSNYDYYVSLAKKYGEDYEPFMNAFTTLKTYMDANNFFSRTDEFELNSEALIDMFYNAYNTIVTLLKSIAGGNLNNLSTYQKGIYNVTAGMVQTSNSVGLVAGDLRVLEDKIETNSAALIVQADAIKESVKKTEIPTLVGELVKVGGVNYFYDKLIQNLGLSKSSNKILEGAQYLGWYVAVEDADIMSIKRWSTPNNEFSYVFTKETPGAGVEYFGGNFGTTEANGTNYQAIDVPEEAKYLFLYLSSDGKSDLPKIKVEYGSISTDYSDPPQEVKDALDKVTTRVGTLEVTAEKITAEVRKKVGTDESYGGVYVTDKGVLLDSTKYSFSLNDDTGFVFTVKDDPSKNLATAGDVNEAVADKAIIIQSDTAPTETENVLWVDTSLAENPVKIYNKELGIWVRSKGEKGDQGIQGLQGEAGDQGIPGKDGTTYYTHIAYSNSDTGSAGFSVSDYANKSYIGIYVDTTPLDSTDPTKYNWTLIKGADGNEGIPGAKGADGRTPYFHIAWANSGDGVTDFSTSGAGNKRYMGTYTDFSVADSIDPTRYTWLLTKGEQGIQGLQGEQGDQGIPGKDGTTYYTHIAYADSYDGKTNFSVSNSNRKYVGMYVDTALADSTDPTKYRWSLIKGADGSQGVAGPKGDDGRTPYFHTAWANSSDGITDFSVTIATGRRYIGTYTDYIAADTTEPSKYTWVLIKGEQGIQGLQGDKGDQGIQGPKGTDGLTSYTHIAYADNDGGTLNFSVSDSNRKYVGMYVDTTPTDSTDPTAYKWSLIKGSDGSQGIQGKTGADGRTPYVHFAYANSADGRTGFSVSDSLNKTYIGTYTDYESPDSTDPTKYTWALIKGDKGDQGTAGKDGTTYYTHLAYANSFDGKVDFSVSDSDRKYIGMYVDTTPTDSSIPSKYRWTLVKGADGAEGIAGPKGSDGRTPYVHFAYATNATGTSGFSVNDSLNKTYIGTYTDYESPDSTDPTKYTWTLIKGDKGDTGDRGIAGKDGTTYYTHIAYSNSVDGKTDFSISNADRNYIGMYVDTNPTDSSDPVAYKWTLVKGQDGTQGIQGKTGADGRTPYFHTAWATNSTGTTGFSLTSSSGKTYLGVYTDYSSADSTDPSKYTWTLVKGDKGDTGEQGPQGLQGVQGAKGDQGIQGPKGATGSSSYTHIAYANNSTGTSGFSVSDSTNKTYIGMYVDSTATDSTDPTKYKWTLIKGADGSQGIQGPKGSDGQTPYLHIAYATNSSGTSGFSTTVSSGKTYIGTYTDYTASDSTDPTKYLWSLMKGDKGDKGDTGPQGLQGIQGLQGDKGDQGIQGPKGTDGLTSYTHIAYATNSTGSEGFSVSDPTNKTYIGIYVDNTPTDSSTPSKYKWTLIKGATGPKGDQGIQGQAGTDGKTPYFHTAWAMSSDGRTGFSVSVSAGKYYIGTYTDYTASDSTDPTKYKWVELANAIGMYIAYAWSPDGTDRFTRVKPGINLVNQSWSISSTYRSDFPFWVYREHGVSGGGLYIQTHTFYKNGDEELYSLKSPKSNNTEIYAVSRNIKVKPNTKYVFSLKGFNNSDLINFDVFFLGSKSDDNTIGGSFNFIHQLISGDKMSVSKLDSRTISFTTKNEESYGYIRIDNNGSSSSTNSGDLYFTEMYLAEYTENPILVPSLADDYDNAVPRYIGRSLKDSNSPSDYKWEPNPERKPWISYAQGVNGEGISLMPYGENLLTGTSNTLSTAKTINYIVPYGWDTVKNFLDKKITIQAYIENAPYDAQVLFWSNSGGTLYGSIIPKGTSGISYITVTVSSSATDGNIAIAFSGQGTLTEPVSLPHSKLKLELANTMNIPTPWTPAPSEDPLGAIPKYVGTAALPYEDWTKYAYTMNPEWADLNATLGLNTKVDNGQYQEDKNGIYESIANRVTKEEADAIRETAQKVLDLYKAYTDPDSGKAAKDLASLESRLTGMVSNLGNKVARWNFIDTWMTVGNEGLSIANSKSSTKILVQNDRISFLDGGTEVAYFSGQQFEIKRGIITQGLQVGQHKWESIDNNNLVLTWVKS